jgi:hypothetical protein
LLLAKCWPDAASFCMLSLACPSSVPSLTPPIAHPASLSAAIAPRSFARNVDVETSPDADTPRPCGVALLVRLAGLLLLLLHD